MEHLGLLGDLLIVFAVSGVVVFLFQHVRVPAAVGFLVAGVLLGPSGLQLVADSERVQVLAEIGVVVLLFTVGLDLSLSRVLRLWRAMLGVGLPQVLVCVAVPTFATLWYLESWGSAIFAGMLAAMSSTAVVLKVLSDRGELGAPQGRIAVPVLLLQDLLVLVFMLLVPVLALQETDTPLWLTLGRGLGVVLLILLAAKYVIPFVLFQVVRTRNRELFLMVVVLLFLGTAALTQISGLSLALGAFLAGLALADSEYAHQTLAEVLPFRDTLSSLFFVSVGMLLDLSVVRDRWALVTATVLAIVALKFTAVVLPVRLIGYPWRIAIVVGLALAQVGEFSFLLAGHGLQFELLKPADYQTFLAAAVITMALTPLLIGLGPRLAARLPDRLGALRPQPKSIAEPEDQLEAAGHVIVAGYGVNGRNLARVLRDVDIAYVVLELNPATVRELRRKGEPIFFGDCSRPAVLEHAGIRRARLLVVAISDPASTRRTVQAARRLNPQLRIIVRTRYLAEIDELRALGADEIIPEEFETSVEIFARVLAAYQVPRNVILDLIDRIRHDHYEVLRDPSLPPARLDLPFDVLSQIEVDTCLIRDDSPAAGRTVGEINLRAETGATLLALRHHQQWIANPGPQTRLQAGDTAVLVGDRPQLDRALLLLDPRLARTKYPSGAADPSTYQEPTETPSNAEAP